MTGFVRTYRLVFQLATLLVSVAPAATAQQSTTWGVTAVPRVTSIADSIIPLDFVGVGKPLVNVHPSSSTLQDASSGRIIGTESLRVCYSDDRECNQPVLVDPARRRSVSLVILGGARRAGTFAGQVALVADSVVPASLTVSIAATSGRRKAGGATLLVTGVALSWLLTVGLRRMILRDQGKLLAARVSERIPDLRARATQLLESAGGKLASMPKLEMALERAEGALSEKAIEALLPAAVSNPFSATQATIDDVASRVAREARALDVVETALSQGLAVALRITQGNEAKVLPLLAKLDDIATLETPETVLLKISEWTGEVRSALQVSGASAGAPSPADRSTTRTLALRVQQESLAGWLFWVLVTSLLGYFAVIESNPGFGLPLDYAKAFAWGLGITLTGQSLQQLTPSTVTTALTFSTAK